MSLKQCNAKRNDHINQRVLLYVLYCRKAYSVSVDESQQCFDKVIKPSETAVVNRKKVFHFVALHCKKSQHIVIQIFCKQCHPSNVTLNEMII